MAQAVRVLVRFRPPRPGAEAAADGVDVRPGAAEVAVGGLGKRFTYDGVFGGAATNEEVFRAAALPLVDAVLQGYHGTVLAYGQTGSGKTHTMLGPDGAHTAQALTDDLNCGIIPRLLSELFQRLQGLPIAEKRWAAQLTCYEIYKETIRDLLAGEADAGKEYRIRQDFTGQRGIYVENLTIHEVGSFDHAMQLLTQAASLRATAATAANDSSSRSHSIVTLDVVQTDVLEGGLRTMGRLNLVDLAGSEKISKTRADGERLKEAQKINLSLTLLGNVIYKLTDGKSLHIPYRDSKLTRLLQESLGGNSQTCLLCMCSPAASDQAETVNTLLFANRAKHIQNKPAVHKELSAAELNMAYLKAQEELRTLKDRLAAFEKGAFSSGRGVPADDATASTERPAKDETAELRETIQSLLKELDEVRAELYEKEDRIRALLQKVQFYQGRSEASEAAAKEWKDKYLREKKACDSWLRKFTELSNDSNGRTKEKPRPAIVKGSSLAKRSASASAAKDVAFLVSGATCGGGGPVLPAKRSSSALPKPRARPSQSASDSDSCVGTNFKVEDDAKAAEEVDADLQGQLAASILQCSELQSLLDRQAQDLQQSAGEVSELVTRNNHLAKCMMELQDLEDRRSAVIDELTRANESHKQAWMNKQRENEALVAEIETRLF
eukprot:EG_transcript_2745